MEAEGAGVIAAEAHIERDTGIEAMIVIGIGSEDTAGVRMIEKGAVKGITIEIAIIEATDTGLATEITAGGVLAPVPETGMTAERNLGLGESSVAIPQVDADVNPNAAVTEMIATGGIDNDRMTSIEFT